MELIVAFILGWFFGCLTFFAGFFLGAVVYNSRKREKTEEATS